MKWKKNNQGENYIIRNNVVLLPTYVLANRLYIMPIQLTYYVKRTNILPDGYYNNRYSTKFGLGWQKSYLWLEETFDKIKLSILETDYYARCIIKFKYNKIPGKDPKRELKSYKKLECFL